MITLPDPSADTVDQGSAFDPMNGVTAQDYEGNDITDRITVEGTVDTSKPGTYKLTYKVTDENGNTVSATRTVQVAEKETQDPGVQTPDNEPGQTQDGNSHGSQVILPGDSQDSDGNVHDQGYQNMSSDNNTGAGVSDLTGNAPKTSDNGSAAAGLSLAGMFAGAAVIGGVIRKKSSVLFRRKK